MHTALLDRSVEALAAVRKHVSFSANLRNQIGQLSFGCKAEGEKCFDMEALFGTSADTTSWRVIDHCAAITRTYALFESFVLQLLREYLLFLSGAYTLTALGPDFKAKYTRGLGQIMLDQDKQRYSYIDIAKLIADANEAMTDTAGYQIQPEALLRNEQNLRMSEFATAFHPVWSDGNRGMGDLAQCGGRFLQGPVPPVGNSGKRATPASRLSQCRGPRRRR
jgi:hypothetical protein